MGTASAKTSSPKRRHSSANQSVAQAHQREVLVKDMVWRVTRALPALLIFSSLAVLIARFYYHLSGGSLVVGATVPLVALFLVSRVIVVFSAFQPMRRPSPRKSSWLMLGTVGILLAALIGTSTFSVAALIFWMLHLLPAAENALWAVQQCSSAAVVAFVVSFVVASLETAWPRIKDSISMSILFVELRTALTQVLSYFLYAPTGISRAGLHSQV